MVRHRRFELRPQGLRIPRSAVDASGLQGDDAGEPPRYCPVFSWVKRPAHYFYACGPAQTARLPACIDHLRELVVPRGNDPRSSGYRPGALPLSYGTVMCFAGMGEGW